jgi:hypothetical protein
LFQKEYKEYKTNFDRIKQIREDLRKDLEDYYKLAPYDKEAAQGKLEMIARKAGTNSIIGAYANKAQVDKIVDFYEKSGNFLQKEEEMARKSGAPGSGCCNWRNASPRCLGGFRSKTYGLRV